MGKGDAPDAVKRLFHVALTGAPDTLATWQQIARKPRQARTAAYRCWRSGSHQAFFSIQAGRARANPPPSLHSRKPSPQGAKEAP